MQLRRILFCNALGFALILSWWLPSVLFWTKLDDDVFFFFNQFISPVYPRWVEALALLNTRAFDHIMFGLLVVILFFAMLRDKSGSWPKWLAIGLIMAAVGALFGEMLHVHLLMERPSPTLFHDGANLLTDYTLVNAKAEAANSFPSDHGLLAMVFATFMLRFADRLIASLSVAVAILVTLPRIMVGGHWVSDVYFGALSIALVALPWILCNAYIMRLVEQMARFFAASFRRLVASLTGSKGV